MELIKTQEQKQLFQIFTQIRLENPLKRIERQTSGLGGADDASC